MRPDTPPGVPLQERPRLFSRTMPAADGFGIPGKRLSLADMVGAGNGLDTGVWGQGIDASAGLITSGRKILKGDDNGFRAMPSLPFIDGVFVPDSNDGSAVVTSTGHRVRAMSQDVRHELRSDRQRSLIPGRLFRRDPLRPAGRADLRHEGQSVHRNAPQRGDHLRPGCNPRRDAGRRDPAVFTPVAACRRTWSALPQRDADPNTIEVTFWVLLDGRPRFSKTLRVVPAQSEQIDVPIGARNRFLTLATTTPGEYRYCWALFAEPALELTRKKP